MALLKPKNSTPLDQPIPDLDPFVLNGLDESLFGLVANQNPAPPQPPSGTDSPIRSGSNRSVATDQGVGSDDFVFVGSNAQIDSDAVVAAVEGPAGVAVNNPFDPLDPGPPADPDVPGDPVNNPFDPVDPGPPADPADPINNPVDPGTPPPDNPGDPDDPVNNPAPTDPLDPTDPDPALGLPYLPPGDSLAASGLLVL